MKKALHLLRSQTSRPTAKLEWLAWFRKSKALVRIPRHLRQIGFNCLLWFRRRAIRLPELQPYHLLSNGRHSAAGSHPCRNLAVARSQRLAAAKG